MRLLPGSHRVILPYREEMDLRFFDDHGNGIGDGCGHSDGSGSGTMRGYGELYSGYGFLEGNGRSGCQLGLLLSRGF
jgi:hypothetical protein